MSSVSTEKGRKEEEGQCRRVPVSEGLWHKGGEGRMSGTPGMEQRRLSTCSPTPGLTVFGDGPVQG